MGQIVTNLLRERSTADFYLEHSLRKVGFNLYSENGIKAWRQGFAQAIAPQVRDSDYSYQHQSPEIDVAVPFEDFHFGAGYTDIPEETMASEHSGAHHYNYTRGVDLSWPNRGYLSPALQTALESDATEVAAAPVKYVETSLGVFLIAGAYIYEWDTTNDYWVERDDASGDGVSYTDLAEMDGVLYAARGDSADYKYSSNGTTWTAFTDADRNFKYFTVRGQSSGEAVLWGLTNTGLLRNTTNGQNSGVAWSAATAMGHTSDTSNGLLVANDQVYGFRKDGIYRYDGTTLEDVWLGGRKMLRDTNGKNPYLWVDQSVYVPYGNRLIRFNPGSNNGAGSIETVWPHSAAVGNDELNGSVTAVTGDADNIYFALKNADGNTYVMKGNPQRDDHGFHTIAYLGANDCNAMFIASPGSVLDNNPVLLVGYGATSRYFILPRDGLMPEDDSGYQFSTTEGVAYGTWMDVGTKSYKKFLNAGRVLLKNASVGNSVKVFYQVDSDDEVELLLADDNGEAVGNPVEVVEFNRIRYVMKFNNSAATKSPHLLSMVFNVVPNPPRKRLWTLDVRIGNGIEQVGGGQKPTSGVDELRFLESSVTQRVNLYDRHERKFAVRVLDVEGIGIIEGARGDIELIRVTLVEI